MENENKEVATTSTLLPDYAKKYAGIGQDDIESSGFNRQFLYIAKDDLEGEIKSGDFYLKSTMQSFGPEISVTVCRAMPTTWRKIKDKKLEKASLDGVTWDTGEKLTEEEQWKCRFLDLIVLLNDTNATPYIYSFKGGSWRNGMKLNDMIKQFGNTTGEPIFMRNWTLYTTRTAHADGGHYYKPNYRLNSGFNSEETLKIAESIYKASDPKKLAAHADAPEISAPDATDFDFGD